MNGFRRRRAAQAIRDSGDMCEGVVREALERDFFSSGLLAGRMMAGDA